MKTLSIKTVGLKRSYLNASETVSYFLLTTALLIGLYTSIFHPQFFEWQYAREDGSVENLTAILLLATSLAALQRLLTVSFRKQKMRLFTTVMIVILFFFAAGEEISWGQRIFNIQSGEFFENYNTQHETNLHNLAFDDVKLNKLIFGKLLTTAVIIYALIVPFLYKKNRYCRFYFDLLGIPMLKTHHSIALLAGILISIAMPNHRKWELYELTLATMMFLIIRYPVNEQIIYKPKSQD